jgi:hypothetical protein
MSEITPQEHLRNAMYLMLKAMPIGLQVDTINLKGTVRRKDRNTWVLFANGIKTRSRWGNIEEMAKDLTYFEENGVLPEPQKVQGF